MNGVKKKMDVVLLAFIGDGSKILLNRRADADSEMWEFIGGGVEGDESPHDAIKREIREEVGYQLDEKRDALAFVDSFRYEGKGNIASVHVFKANHPGLGNFVDSEETLVKDLRLFSVDEALNLVLLPMTRTILERALLPL